METKINELRKNGNRKCRKTERDKKNNNTRTKIKDKIITKKRIRAKPQSIKSAGVS